MLPLQGPPYPLLSSLQRKQPSFKLYLSRIARFEKCSCSDSNHPIQNTSHLTLHYSATDSLNHLLFVDSFSFCTTSGPGPGKWPDFWDSMDFHRAPVPQKVSVNNNNNKNKRQQTADNPAISNTSGFETYHERQWCN